MSGPGIDIDFTPDQLNSLYDVDQPHTLFAGFDLENIGRIETPPVFADLENRATVVDRILKFDSARLGVFVYIDHDFLDFYGLKLLAGRNFIKGSKQDYMCHIINRKAVKLLGFDSPEDAIGQELETPNWYMTKKIVGVIENYHQESLREEFAPTIYTYLPHPRWSKQYSIKVHPDNLAHTIGKVEKDFHAFFPGNTFEYFFLDQHFDQQYRSDREFGKTFAIFAFLAIVISVMGLFALSLYFTLQRNREIAVRKVMGAGLDNLFVLLTRDFFGLLLLSLLIAFPAAYLIMNSWLNNYANRIGFGFWFFIIPVLIMCMVILISIIYQIYRTARVNPADTLRYE